jgi:hypothetical protein
MRTWRKPYPASSHRNPLPDNTSGAEAGRLTRPLHGASETTGQNAAVQQADADLARVVTAWPDLPAHIKAAVLALVQTAQ